MGEGESIYMYKTTPKCCFNIVWFWFEFEMLNLTAAATTLCFCQDYCYLNLIRGFKITFEQSERFERKTLNSRLLPGKKQKIIMKRRIGFLRLIYCILCAEYSKIAEIIFRKQISREKKNSRRTGPASHRTAKV